MADAAEASKPAPPTLLIDLKVVSPSTEIDEGGLSFPSLPAATTVGELKLKILDTVATHPTLDRQRLIYRGHVLADNDTTLLNLFGEQAIQQSRAQTLHLVLRELSSSHRPGPSASTTASTASPNPFRPATASPAGQPHTNPFRSQPAGPTPQSQPPHGHINPHPHPHHHHHPLPPPFPPFFGAPPGGFPPIPPEINTIFQQQIAAARAHQQAHMHRPASPLPPHQQQRQSNGSPAPASAPTPDPQQPQATFQQYVNQQQQNRAAAGMQGVNSATTNNNAAQSNAPATRGEGTPAPVPGRTPTPGQNRSATPHPPQTTSSFTREVIGPNGERLTVTVNNTAGVPGPNMMPTHGPHMSSFPHLPDFTAGFRAGTPPVGLGLPPPPGYGNMFPLRRAGSPARSDRGDLQRIRASLEQAHREVESIRNLIQAIPRPEDESQSSVLAGHQNHIRAHTENLMRNLDQMQASLNSLVVSPEFAQHRDLVSLQMLNNSLRSQAGGLVQNLTQPQPPRQPHDATNHVTPSTSANPTVTVSTSPPSSDSQSTANTQSTPTVQHPASTQPTGSASGTANQPNDTTATPAAVNGTTTPSTTQPTIYLLSGPQGPHALVIGPTGQYTTPTIPWNILNQIRTAPSLEAVESHVRQIQHQLYGYTPPPEPPAPDPVLPPQVEVEANAEGGDFQHIPLPWLNRLQNRPPDAQQNAQQNAQQPAPQPPPRLPPGNALVCPGVGIGPRPQPEQPQPANANAPQPDDPNAPPQPQQPTWQEALNWALGNIWFVIRLVLFAYLFAGGYSWTRPAVVVIGIVHWLVQAGMFPVAWFEGVRRYWEELLVGAMGEGQGGAGGAQAGEQADGAGGQPGAVTGAQGQAQARDPTPEQAAARLLADRAGHRREWIRQQLRSVERAVALFVASLFPGMGERILAARDQAEVEEAVRRRVAQEEQERREREAREKEEAERQEQEAAKEGREGGVEGSTGAPVPSEGDAPESTPTPTAEAGGSAKGKERAADVGEAAEGSSSAVAGQSSSAPDDDGVRRRHE